MAKKYVSKKQFNKFSIPTEYVVDMDTVQRAQFVRPTGRYDAKQPVKEAVDKSIEVATKEVVEAFTRMPEWLAKDIAQEAKKTYIERIDALPKDYVEKHVDTSKDGQTRAITAIAKHIAMEKGFPLKFRKSATIGDLI